MYIFFSSHSSCYDVIQLGRHLPTAKLAHSGKHHGADTKVNDSSVVGQRNKGTSLSFY